MDNELVRFECIAPEKRAVSLLPSAGLQYPFLFPCSTVASAAGECVLSTFLLLSMSAGCHLGQEAEVN